MNALIQHTHATLHTLHHNVYRRVVALFPHGEDLLLSIERVLTAEPEQVIQRWIFPFVFYLGDASIETCRRVNTLLRFSQSRLYAEVGNTTLRIGGLKPLDDIWLECLALEQDDGLHIFRQYYRPFVLWLGKRVEMP